MHVYMTTCEHAESMISFCLIARRNSGDVNVSIHSTYYQNRLKKMFLLDKTVHSISKCDLLGIKFFTIVILVSTFIV